MNRTIAALTLVIIGMSLIGMEACAPFTPASRTPAADAVPSAFTDSSDEPLRRAMHWWETFGSPQLSALISEGLGDNFSLQQSWARLNQADALAVQSGAALVPDLSLEANAASGLQHTADGTTDGTEGVQNYSLGLFSRYEIDLWGRIRSEQQASLLSVRATREDLNTAAMTLAANIATRWIGILAQQRQKRLLERQLAVNLTYLELVELRYHKSLASALDVFQQRQVVAQSRAQLPLVEKEERLLLNELTVLLGRTSFAPPTIKALPLNIPEEPPAAGIPAQLLTARPDIRAALLRLQAADWRVAAARADQLPNISLTAGAAYEADETALLLDNWFLNLAANLTAPLIDGRRRSAEVDRLRGLVDEYLAAYKEIILTAIREVEDALVSELKLREHLEGLKLQLNAAQNGLNEARSRYRNGLNDYLPVLTQLLAVQNLERDIIMRKADLLVARINLYRALGGTWTDRLTPPQDKP